MADVFVELIDIIKLKGFDKEGLALVIACVSHRLSDLQMEGLGKSIEGVKLEESVVIPQYAALDNI